MREIKLRAWDEDRQKMIVDFRQKSPAIFQNDEGNFFCGSYQRNGDWQEPKLMQFTGLKDKNGKEIYEGDICEIDGGAFEKPYFEVAFEHGCFVAKMPWIDPEKQSYPELKAYIGMRFCEVLIVGNIYQNPELLKRP